MCFRIFSIFFSCMEVWVVWGFQKNLGLGPESARKRPGKRFLCKLPNK